MNVLTQVNLRKRLIYLFVLIAIGLIVTGLIGVVHARAMKKNMDTLYFGSLMPLVELNNILHSYEVDITNSLTRAKNLRISLSQMDIETKLAMEKIEKNWNEYVLRYKKSEEIEYIDYTSLEIKNTNEYLMLLLNMLSGGDGDIKKLNVSNFEDKMGHIIGILNKLIEYELDSAKFERSSFLQDYDLAIMRTNIILILLSLVVLITSYYVFKSIQKSQHSLHFVTTKLRLAKKRLESITYVDTLTTLFNRRYFNIIYDRELKRAKRANSHITFMMIDIDYFKQYNDTYGHLQGDKILKNVALKLKERLKRPSDFIFRFGGEEFCILLVDTPEANSYEMACELNEAIKELSITHGGSKVSNIVTISVGIACCVADEALDAEVLIGVADDMLYKAKANGRDRCEITTVIRR